MSCAPKEPSDAPPQKLLSRSCAHDLRNHTQADQGGTCLSPCTGRPCGGRGSTRLAVSTTFHLANSALRKWVQRFAHEGPQACWIDHAPATAQGHVRAGTTPQSPHRSRPLEHGSLHSQWSCRELATVLAHRPGSNSAVKVCAVLKKGHKLLPPHRATGSRPGCSRLRPHSHLPPSSTRLAGARSSCSMKTKRFSGALPCPGRLVAQNAAHTPPHTPAEPEPNQTRGGPQTPSLVAVSLLEPDHQRGLAQRHWRGPVWHLQSFHKIVPHFDAQELRQYMHQ